MHAYLLAQHLPLQRIARRVVLRGVTAAARIGNHTSCAKGPICISCARNTAAPPATGVAFTARHTPCTVTHRLRSLRTCLPGGMGVMVEGLAVAVQYQRAVRHRSPAVVWARAAVG